jgi:hypothetical protein
MAEGKTPTDIDVLVDEEVTTTGLTPKEIKSAIQSELVARAAKRILDKVDRAGRPPTKPTGGERQA